MELKKPVSAIDRVIVEIDRLNREFRGGPRSLRSELRGGVQSLECELLGGFQTLRDDMNRGFASIDRGLSSVEKQLDSYMEVIEIANKNCALFLAFIFHVVIISIGFSVINYLAHIH